MAYPTRRYYTPTRHSVSDPGKILYESYSDSKAKRTSFLSGYGGVTKTDYDVITSGYYYVVVKAEKAIVNQRYDLYVGNPLLMANFTTVKGSSFTVSKVNTNTNTTITVNSSSTMPKTAVVRSIYTSAMSETGYAQVGIKKSTETAYHSGQYAFSYTYASEWKNEGIKLVGTWDYRANISSSQYIPVTFTPYMDVNYWYEIGD